MKTNYKKLLSDCYSATRQGGQLEVERVKATIDQLKAEQQWEYYSYFMQLLCDHFYRVGRFDEALPMLDDLEALGRDFGGYPAIYHQLLSATYHWYAKGDIDKAIHHSQTALEIYEQSGITQQNAKLMGNNILGAALYQKGDYLRAYECLYIAQNCRLAEVFKYQKALIYMWMGNIEEHYHNLRQALNDYLICADILKKHNLEKSACDTICNIGCLYFDMGKLDLAYQYYTESLQIAQKYERTVSICDALGNIAMYHNKLKDYDKADEYYDRWHEIEKRPDRIALYHSLKGENYLDNGKIEDAENHLSESLSLFTQQGDSYSLVESHKNLTKLHKKKGDYSAALSHIAQAETLVTELSSKELLRGVYEIYADLYAETRQYEAASALFQKYIVLVKDIEKQKQDESFEFDMFKNELKRKYQG